MSTSPEAAAPSSSTSAAPATVSDDTPVEDLLPETVGGEALQTQSGDVGGFLQGRSLRALNRALRATDKRQRDLTYTIAVVPDGSAAITAIDVDGADAAAYEAFVLESVLSGLSSRRHTKETGVVAGKTVTIVHPRGAPADSAIYIYPAGDVVWTVIAKDPELSEVLSALP